MRYIIYIILWVGCKVLIGCSDRSERLETVLKYSGTNRTELEKVLEHYSQHPADSLKLKSAIFLIENMPGHYTFSGTFLDQYYAKLDTVKNTPYHEKKLLQTIPFERQPYRNDLQIREDVKCIQADFLIHSIDLAFRQWQTSPWLEGVDFDTFKEYLLPYRIENETLDYWRDSISYFQERLGNYVNFDEDCRYSSYYLRNRFYSYIPFIEKKIPEPDFRDFKLECIPNSKLQMLTYRIIGIPSAIDFIPHFANRNGRHYWAATPDPSVNLYQVFQAEIYRVAKVYRRTYSHNPVVMPESNEYVPAFFKDPFNKDVTNLYLPTIDITIHIPRHLKIRHAYLAVFNDLTWKPIACSKLSGRQACFTDMGKDIVYLPVYYDENEEMCPLASPFIIHSDGRRQNLNVNKDSVQPFTLVRKYPYSSENDYWAKELIGTRFEAANREDFSNADTLFQITKRTNFQYQYIYPDTTIEKRYWRFTNPNPRGCNLADLHFYNTANQEIKGKVFGLDSIKAQGVLDNDPLTMSNIAKQIGMDFGKPVRISCIRYLARNDANGIYPDNDYELFYYDFPEGWVSLGLQTATGYELTYDQVQSAGLYWLRNLTSGQEERIFTWENGKARFW